MLMRCHWLWWNISWHRSRSNWKCQWYMCCLAPLSLRSAGAEMPGMPFPAWPCPKPSLLLLAEVSLAHLLWQEVPAHVLGVKHGHGASLHPLAPCLGTSQRFSGPAPWHSPCFHTWHVSRWVSPQRLFVPSLTARLKSSCHRQRERNILQVCNSLKHWTFFNTSLLSGRQEGRHVQTVENSNIAVEFGSISAD